MLQDFVKNLSIDNFRIKNSARRPALVTDGIRFFLISTKKCQNYILMRPKLFSSTYFEVI